MKHWVMISLLALIWAVVLSILLTPEVPNGHGFGHPRFQAMDQGGDGVERHGSLFFAGWMYGSVLIAVFVSLLTWGTVDPASQADTSPAKHRKLDLRLVAFIVCGLIYEGVFTAMCVVYRNSLTAAEVAFVGPFPAGVSWLLFGLWPIPGLFVVYYVVFFRRWILPPTSLRKLAAYADQVADDSSELLSSDRKD